MFHLGNWSCTGNASGMEPRASIIWMDLDIPVILICSYTNIDTNLCLSQCTMKG